MLSCWGETRGETYQTHSREQHHHWSPSTFLRKQKAPVCRAQGAEDPIICKAVQIFMDLFCFVDVPGPGKGLQLPQERRFKGNLFLMRLPNLG